MATVKGFIQSGLFGDPVCSLAVQCSTASDVNQGNQPRAQQT
jgi:hypothetical protein